MYYLCEKYYKPVTVQYYIADYVIWLPRLTLSDLWTRSQNRTHSFVGDLVYFFPGGSEVKASAHNAGALGSIPGSGRSPGEGNGNPLQYSYLETPMEGEAW